MTYKLIVDGDRVLIVVEGVKDNNTTEVSFTVPTSGDYSLLKNSLVMCEDKVYKELNKDI